MTNIFIFHGTGGNPEENWFPWLREKLQAQGLTVFVPQFPTPEGQSLETWLDVFEPYLNEINRDTILIGHSLGGIFTLKLLERLQNPIKLAVFVGTPIGVGWIKNYERDKSFAGFDFDWKKIKTKAKDFIVYQSDNDPYVSLQNGQELAKRLGTDLTFISNAGHFNTKSGYTHFNDLFNKLKKHL